MELARRTDGKIVLNHLEALDHCPTTREGLRERMSAEGLADRTFVPEDGEELVFARDRSRSRAVPRTMAEERPGVQKWVASRFAG